MKKILSFVLCLLIVPSILFLSACKDDNSTTNKIDTLDEKGNTFVYSTIITTWNTELTQDEINIAINESGMTENEYLQMQASIFSSMVSNYQLIFGNGDGSFIVKTSASNDVSNQFYYERESDKIKIYQNSQKEEANLSNLFINNTFIVGKDQITTKLLIDKVQLNIIFVLQ